MSIRKRLIISHAAMIITPIFMIALIMGLLHVVLNGDMPFNSGQWWGKEQETQEQQLFNQLKKTASLDQDKLYDASYLNMVNEQLKKEESNLVIRKGNELIYSSKQVETLQSNELPSFGNEEYGPGIRRIGNGKYSVLQYDFYFQDGMEGSILILNTSSSFVAFARVFFPILFLSLILILVLTNGLLSYFMSKRILQPVNQLSSAADKISRGDFDFTVKAKGKDELNKLLSTFDNMRLQLKESLELRDKYEHNRRELVANISHDLKTPITSIIGYVEGIQDGVANTQEKQKQYFDTIHAKATYINQLIEELSLFSKLDVKREAFHFEVVNITAFFDDYLKEIEDDLEEKGIELLFQSGKINSNVLLDRNKMIRVVQNIIYNSVKYMERTPGQIAVSLTDKEEMIEVCISDNGTGVPEEELKNIFTRFYRIDASRSTSGSGLGLAIASQIIRTHGGMIWAGNSQSCGLSVYFTLPKEKDDRIG
ncbi:HAMP domain-containing sensor histidine kinase [Gracilibacillus sp. D59]|uniref:HAMP domain-containing sensor histidine kinase n=1 Tax=Gracilibacillus sp. D59 TaxID=3457434 RepID=UPI003FCD840F